MLPPVTVLPQCSFLPLPVQYWHYEQMCKWMILCSELFEVFFWRTPAVSLPSDSFPVYHCSLKQTEDQTPTVIAEVFRSQFNAGIKATWRYVQLWSGFAFDSFSLICSSKNCLCFLWKIVYIVETELVWEFFFFFFFYNKYTCKLLSCCIFYDLESEIFTPNTDHIRNLYIK